MSPLAVIIAGGGTGGHLYPGIAVARELQQRAPEAVITFAGTARGIEARVVPQEGFPLDLLRSAGLKGASPMALMRGLTLMPLGGLDAWRILSRRRPSLVIGVGGYSSGPVVLVAALRGIRTMLLEQNATPGLTNRLLARIVDAAAVSFASTAPHFGARAFVAGNPVRPAFLADERAQEADATGPVRVLVFGGSQGAHAINMAMVDAAPELARQPGLAITHQTGAADLDRVRQAYALAGLTARVEAFLYDMATEMNRADLVVCRAGATTLAELTAAARPALLIPLPTATDDHQRRNAETLAHAGAAELLEQRQLSGERLAARIVALASDVTRREAMRRQARTFARPDAARVIVDRALELVGR
jgi:UDP-N-acetylglucosamine--N-acetylmuramyl-(pentapeptide) pyrophosphoryl-undecaprenol N-acetylglucosamine transferase